MRPECEDQNEGVNAIMLLCDYVQVTRYLEKSVHVHVHVHAEVMYENRSMNTTK